LFFDINIYKSTDEIDLQIFTLPHIIVAIQCLAVAVAVVVITLLCLCCIRKRKRPRVSDGNNAAFEIPLSDLPASKNQNGRA